MPIYEFRCRQCGETFEALRPMGDTGRSLDCPKCGARSPEKLASAFSAGSCSVPAGSGFG